MNVVIITLDSHLRSATLRASKRLQKNVKGLQVQLHAATEWENNADALTACHKDISEGNIIIVTMLVMEDHINAVLPALKQRNDKCDAMICCMSASEIMKLTTMGRFSMAKPSSGPLALLKRLRGRKASSNKTAGAQQLAVLRKLPRILRYIPGTAQDLRAYFLTLQYWLAGSEQNVEQMIRFLVNRYADGARHSLRGTIKTKDPIEYPEIGLYHPNLKSQITEQISKLPVCKKPVGTVGPFSDEVLRTSWKYGAL